MERRVARRIWAGLLATLLWTSCPASDGARRSGRPSLLLVSLDTVRADHTSLLGYARPTTPRLEALARQGVSFTRAYAMTSTTGPSHATLFTGRYAPAHGVARNGMPLAEQATTLAERLSARGYRTGGVLGSFVLARRFGFGQGFADWDESFRRETSSLPMRTWEGREVPGGAFDRAGPETTRLAVDWLRRNGRSGPFFLFVHYFDAHEPYTPSATDLARMAATPIPGPAAEELARYDAEISEVDRQVGALLDGLDALGLAEDTLVVVTSDHGQGLNDHDGRQHSVNIYEESVRAVLVFRGPGIAPAGRVSDGPVQAVDVVPTVLDALEPGSQAGADLPGRSLAGFLRGEAPRAPAGPVFLYRQLYPRPSVVRRVPVRGAQFGIRLGGWKYIEGDRDGRRELYDLSRDPGELVNRAAEAPARRLDLQARLHAWRAANPRPGGPPPRISDEDRARLRALGYAD